MGEARKLVFVSNYLNHHQIPFCNAMSKLLGGDFVFIQTEPVEEERVRMGWNASNDLDYLKLYYEAQEECRELIAQAKVVLFGGSEDESLIADRLEAGKPVIRYSERLYKTGQWKAVSPRGLKKKYHDHTRHQNKPVYLLCSGAYVPSDFQIVRAYMGKKYVWGYFPETKHYDAEALIAGKGYVTETGEKLPYLLWAARMIDWKHPELALETAKYLKDKGLRFHMDVIGGGDFFEKMTALRTEYGLEEYVDFPGFLKPAHVREYMEKANIYLFTSDRQEGWGAVANEAMNSGCALIADHMIGAVPYLVRDGENGLIYRNGDKEQLFALAERLVKNPSTCEQLGREAYKTIIQVWNPENAALQLSKLAMELGLFTRADFSEEDLAAAEAYFKNGSEKYPAPCQPAKVISERKMYGAIHAKGTD